MEQIKNAVRIAKASAKRDQHRAPVHEPEAVERREMPVVENRFLRNQLADRWSPPRVALDPAHLEAHRILCDDAAPHDTSPGMFNVLRTKTYMTLSNNKWRSLAITSPTAGCGKTMVAINLALSLARQKGCRTVLIDLDLHRSSVAPTLGIEPPTSIGQFLAGNVALHECFVEISEDLYVGLGDHRLNKGIELAQHREISEIISGVIYGLDPEVVIVDLPPMRHSDDVMAFLPFVDAGFLVAAAGKTTSREIEECETEFSEQTPFMGVVLNKCMDRGEDYYQYSRP